MADITKDLAARLKIEKEGDAGTFRETAEEIRDLGKAASEAGPALDQNAAAMRKAGEQADWVKQQVESILGPTREAATAQKDLGDAMASTGQAGEKAGASLSSVTGLLTALLLKIDPTKTNLAQLNAAFEASIGITEKLADVTGTELPDSYRAATEAASRFVEAIATGKLPKAFDELQNYMEGVREYAADTLNWLDKLAGGGAKANDQLLESMAAARGSLQETMRLQREMVKAREEEVAALTQQSAVLERQIKAEQASGEVTKQTRDAAQGLLDKWEELGKTGPKAFEETAKQANIFSTAVEKAADKAAKLTEAAGTGGASAAVEQLGKSLWDAGGPLGDFAEEADRVSERLAKLRETNPQATLDDVSKSSSDAAESLAEVTTSADEFTTSIEESQQKVEEFVDTAGQDLRDFADDAAQSFGDLVKETGSAFDRITQNAQDANDRLFKPGNENPYMGPPGDPGNTAPSSGETGTQKPDAKQQQIADLKKAAEEASDAFEDARRILEDFTTAADQATSNALPGLATGLNEVAAAVKAIAGGGGEEGEGSANGLAKMAADLSALAAVEFASAIVEQLNSIKEAAEQAAAAVAKIPAAAGDDDSTGDTGGSNAAPSGAQEGEG